MPQLQSLVYNLLLVICLAAVGSYFILVLPQRRADWLKGLFFGLGVVLIMSTPLALGEGWILDFRGVILSLAGYAGGGVIALVTVAIALGYRLWFGGAGAPSGAMSIIAFGVLGLALRHTHTSRRLRNPIIPLALGSILAGITLIGIAGISFSSAERMYMMHGVAAYVLFLVPLATWAAWWVLDVVEQAMHKYTALDSAFHVSPAHAVVLGADSAVALCTGGLAAHPELKDEIIPHLRVATQDNGLQQEISMHVNGSPVDYWLELETVTLPQGARGNVAILEDITELKQATIQLDRFFELSPDALIIMGWDGYIRRANKSLEAMLKCDRQTLMLTPITAFIHSEDLERTLDSFRGCREENAPLKDFENRIVAVDGTIHWLSWTAVPVEEQQALFAVARNITQLRAEASTMAERSAELCDQLELLELAQDAIIVRQLDNTITFWNLGAEKTYGWNATGVLGANYHDTLPSEYSTYMDDIENELLVRDYWYGQATRLTRDGSRIVVDCQWAMQRDQLGWPLAVLEISRDITERQQAEVSLGHLASIVEQSDDGIISAAISEEILTWNQGAESLLGYTAAEVQGTPLSRLFTEGEISTWQDTLAKLHQGLVAGPMEVDMQHKDGTAVAVLVSFSPIRNLLGQPTAISLVIRDNTRKKQLDKEMARLDRLNLAGQLAAGIGHEVRNPMTTVRGFLQLFSKKPELTQYVEQFKLVISELDRANDIITEFLTLARNRPMEFSAADLNDIIKALLPLLRADAVNSGKVIELDLALVPTLNLNEKEIRQLLLNLVRNGLEAMPAGGTLTIRTKYSNGKVTLTVEDQGGGIPAEVVEKIGTPFFTTKQNGTGLGLAVCYTIAEQHGATITFDTSEQGTVFHVNFSLLQ